MSKLLNDPKIAALIDREVTKAVKAERKRCLEEVKAFGKHLTDAAKSLAGEIKDPTLFDTDSVDEE